MRSILRYSVFDLCSIDCIAYFDDGIPPVSLTGVEEYFPLMPAQAFRYKVDSGKYDMLGTNTTKSLSILEERISYRVTNNSGNEVYPIERCLSDTLKSDLCFQRPSSADYSDDNTVCKEGNIGFLKVHTPLTLDCIWERYQFVHSFPMTKEESPEIFKFWEVTYCVPERQESYETGEHFYEYVITVFQGMPVSGLSGDMLVKNVSEIWV